MWDHLFHYLVSARDRLIQYKILHRINYTPARLAAIYCTDLAHCWHCQYSPAKFEHMFEFWQEVTQTLGNITALRVPITISVYLLGLMEELAPLRVQRTLLSVTFSMHRKQVSCIGKTAAPSLDFWKALINMALPFFNATCLNRGCPKKFEKVWQS